MESYRDTSGKHNVGLPISFSSLLLTPPPTGTHTTAEWTLIRTCYHDTTIEHDTGFPALFVPQLVTAKSNLTQTSYSDTSNEHDTGVPVLFVPQLATLAHMEIR